MGTALGTARTPESIAGLDWCRLGCGDEALPAPALHSLSKQGQSQLVAGGCRSPLTVSPCVPPHSVKD